MIDEKNHLAVVGKRVLAARERAGMNQKDLAERVGMSQSRISKLERGAVGVDYLVMWRIAQVLGVSLDNLLSGNEGGYRQDVKEIQADYTANPGVLDLAGDKSTINALAITQAELEILHKISAILPKAKKEGVLQLLFTLRAIA
jgi:transcriptional regulator with XRE-family HTH domain